MPEQVRRQVAGFNHGLFLLGNKESRKRIDFLLPYISTASLPSWIPGFLIDRLSASLTLATHSKGRGLQKLLLDC